MREAVASPIEPVLGASSAITNAGTDDHHRPELPITFTGIRMPARSPELNPVENLWQFIRENWLGNRIFTSYEAILDHCCDAWNKLIGQPWRIMSVGLRAWAHEF